jgi:anti-sigma factor RsiW
MSTTPECDKVLLVQAELDGELDAAAAAALAAHRAHCPICREAAAELAQARGLIDAGLYEPMPEAARARLLQRLAAAQPARSEAAPSPGWVRGWWSAAASFGVGAACAAALALFMLSPAEPGLTDQVVAGHIRALQPGHLADVASDDRHTVKPWFDGRLDFAPPVKDLTAQRFPLQGGRLDYLAGRPVAALVYQRDRHVIDLFVWPAAGETLPQTAERHGYNLVHWSQNGMNFWAVSDLEAAQLREFVEDWRRAP